MNDEKRRKLIGKIKSKGVLVRLDGEEVAAISRALQYGFDPFVQAKEPIRDQPELQMRWQAMFEKARVKMKLAHDAIEANVSQALLERKVTAPSESLKEEG